MKLEELLSVCDECSSVAVYRDDDEELLAEYDGRDSIDEKYNDWIVCEVVGRYRRFEVYVKEV